jgi:hypothetical protein
MLSRLLPEPIYPCTWEKQMSGDEERRNYADFIFDNNGSITDLEEQLFYIREKVFLNFVTIFPDSYFIHNHFCTEH